MTVDIHFANAEKPVRTSVSYEAEGLAQALSGDAGANQRVGNYVRVRLLNNEEVLVNPAAVAFLKNVTD